MKDMKYMKCNGKQKSAKPEKSFVCDSLVRKISSCSSMKENKEKDCDDDSGLRGKEHMEDSSIFHSFQENLLIQSPVIPHFSSKSKKVEKNTNKIGDRKRKGQKHVYTKIAKKMRSQPKWSDIMTFGVTIPKTNSKSSALINKDKVKNIFQEMPIKSDIEFMQSVGSSPCTSNGIYEENDSIQCIEDECCDFLIEINESPRMSESIHVINGAISENCDFSIEINEQTVENVHTVNRIVSENQECSFGKDVNEQILSTLKNFEPQHNLTTFNSPFVLHCDNSKNNNKEQVFSHPVQSYSISQRIQSHSISHSISSSHHNASFIYSEKSQHFSSDNSCITEVENVKVPKLSNDFILSELLALCKQDSIISFSDIYDWQAFKIEKIGSGAFGEVFYIWKTRYSCGCVLKIIPVLVDDETSDLKLQSVLSEVKVSQCLSDLSSGTVNKTRNFAKLKSSRVVSGSYPSLLVDAWDDFRVVRSCYNKRPDKYENTQIFVVLELEYCGEDLTLFKLKSAVEAESVLKQIAVSLAVAEEVFLFEHRDLHLGNILIQKVNAKNISYKLKGKKILVKSHGLIATIIDFTFSRLRDKGEKECIYYNDLAADNSLFEQSGDFQFQVYRSMREHVGNLWHECCLYSNVLWLNFLCIKFQTCKYRCPNSEAHKKALKAIKNFKANLEKCSSALDCLSACGVTVEKFEKPQNSQLSGKSVLISRT